ncbi:hypothetical protein NP493_52g02019 [Ridgeia piscesae]|uniref:Uncharacterized protein n=1 Tax=Ridgeia piscesae TaxID=27915 RepID=A0AAD9PB38_RIDPI|nr:hypothetical protein NP493_52g02019 [Ridgeia piscesae]
MVLRMLVTRCSHYLRHAPHVTGPTTVSRLCSVLVQSENLGSMALCCYHNLTCMAQFAGAGNISISQVRGYAKKGGGRRDKGKKDGKPAVNLSPKELNEIVNFEKMKSQMDMALEHMKQEYFTQLTVRNTSGMFMNT